MRGKVPATLFADRLQGKRGRGGQCVWRRGFSRWSECTPRVLLRPNPGNAVLSCACLERSVPVSSERVERRLTAILAADVAGYSRLTGLDEEGTHAQLQVRARVVNRHREWRIVSGRRVCSGYCGRAFERWMTGGPSATPGRVCPRPRTRAAGVPQQLSFPALAKIACTWPRVIGAPGCSRTAKFPGIASTRLKPELKRLI